MILTGAGAVLLGLLAGCSTSSSEDDRSNPNEPNKSTDSWDRTITESGIVLLRPNKDSVAEGSVLWRNPEIGGIALFQQLAYGLAIDSDPETLSFDTEESLDLGHWGSGYTLLGSTIVDGVKWQISLFLTGGEEGMSVGLGVTSPDVFNQYGFEGLNETLRATFPTETSQRESHTVIDEMENSFVLRDPLFLPALRTDGEKALCRMLETQQDHLWKAAHKISKRSIDLNREWSDAVAAVNAETNMDQIYALQDRYLPQIQRLQAERDQLLREINIKTTQISRCKRGEVGPLVDELKSRAKLADAVYYFDKPPENWEMDESKRVSETSYQGVILRNPETGESWEVVDSKTDSETGYQAAAYRNTKTGEIVIAHAGTDPLQSGDLVADITQGIGLVTSQYRQAEEFVRQIHDMFPGQRIEQIGHSLGGGLAEASAMKFGDPATVFNPAGVHKNTIRFSPTAKRLGDIAMDHDRRAGLVASISTEGDILTNAQEYYNDPIPLPLTKNTMLGRILPPGSIPKSGGTKLVVKNKENQTWFDKFVSAVNIFEGVKNHLMDSVIDGLDNLTD